MESKDNISSNKINISDKLKKSGVKKLLLVIALLTIVITIILLLVLFNKHTVNKSDEYSFRFRGMDLYCKSTHTEYTLDGKWVYCDMVAENNGAMNLYLRRNVHGLDDIAVEPGAKERFTLKWYNLYKDKSDTMKGQIEIFNAKVPPSLVWNYKEIQQRKEHRMCILHYTIERDGFTYTWKPLDAIDF